MSPLEDRISLQPDEILVHIISLLKMKGAGRTSELSKRWRYIWAYIPNLEFIDIDTLVEINLGTKLLDVERPRYLNWVNQVVRSYKGLTIDEFKVNFDIDAASTNCVDNWLIFVMEKRVKRLQLKFGGGVRESCYTFPNWWFCNSLTILDLISINVTGEILENFFKNCPQLESVKVKYSKTLVNLAVESLKLESLVINECFAVEFIEIFAPKLLSFEYIGPIISMPLRSTPKLSKLRVGGACAEHLANNFSELSSHLSQLKSLMLDLRTMQEFTIKYDGGIPECKMLNYLEVTVDPGEHGNLFDLSPLIKASPCLQTFDLQLSWKKPTLERNQLKVEAFTHSQLKSLFIFGFVGNAIDLEFIMYLVESCVALEEIVVVSHWSCEEDEKRKLSDYVKKFKPYAKLSIL